MELSGPDFSNNDLIPSRYTCDGENINPELEIRDVPKEAKSLALIVDDPDAAGGSWVHWILWNISPNEERIAVGSVPAGAVEGTTSFGKTCYGGPCPPSGTHRYFFKLYALNAILNLDKSATVDELENAIESHLIAKCELVGLYAKNGV